jgi:hypothetical protein
MAGFSDGLMESGVRNRIRGDVNSTVSLSVASQDPKYRPLTGAIHVTNVDIYWPHALQLYPEIYPIAGMNGSLSGGTGHRPAFLR